MKNRSLTFKFTLIFATFTLVALAVTSVLSYLSQMHIYKEQKEDNLQKVAVYLEKMLSSDSEEFLAFNKYFIEHASDFRIPIDFGWKEVEADRIIYENLFAEQNPGKVLGQTIEFDDFSDELKHAFTQYNFEYYRMVFDSVQDNFDVAFAYYIVPTGDKGHMYWVLDPIREPKNFAGKLYLNLCDNVPNSEEGYPKMWEAWYTGKSPKGYHIYNNQYGKTYAYYRPFIINGEKIGVIGVEVEIADVNHDILMHTIQQMIVIGSVLIAVMILLLLLIRSRYIYRLVKFCNYIEEYSSSKDAKIAENLIKEITNKDEICMIMSKFSDMIYELELYIHNLTKTKQDLQNTRLQAIELNELALKDPLTGIRNKLGYDKEVQLIEWQIAEGLREFGLAMIDLNYLKKINDDCGHDKGDLAITDLARTTCKIFEHSPVFRIDDDEFAVILKGEDLENIDELILEFQRTLNERQALSHLEYWERISAAIGYAIFNPEIDKSFESLFKRAERSMYDDKKAVKALKKE